MKTIRQQVEVTFHYPVHFTRDLFAADNPLLADTLLGGALPGAGPKRVLVVVDKGVTRYHPDLTADLAAYLRGRKKLKLVAAPLVVAGGEATKNAPENVLAVQEAVHTHGIDRHSYVLAVGGGALLDMVGYAAATTHRGVRLVRVPTTVLSQNDSAVGVKNGVNAFRKKNFLGTFAPPYAVLSDLNFLETLEQRDWVGGLSEAVKVALLKDAAFFDFLETNAEKLKDRDAEAMAHAVYRCAELHFEHIATSGDPFEFGSSRPLDFGHWAAHKLEALTHYELRHGEAVAVGIALDSTYAHLSRDVERKRPETYLGRFYHPGPTDVRARVRKPCSCQAGSKRISGASRWTAHHHAVRRYRARRGGSRVGRNAHRACGLTSQGGNMDEKVRNTCPLGQRELIDRYFIEHRNQVLAIAAFLDRMDRSVSQDAGDEFRFVALKKAVQELTTGDFRAC